MTSSTQCYGRSMFGGIYAVNGYVPCPTGMSCCAKGDTCLTNNFCHNSTSSHTSEGTYSGYYLAACQDSTYANANCNNACSDESTYDVVYNATNNLWACCGTVNGLVSCDNPTMVTFTAPAPAKLATMTEDISSSMAVSATASTSSHTTIPTISSTATLTSAATAGSATRSISSPTASFASTSSITNSSISAPSSDSKSSWQWSSIAIAGLETGAGIVLFFLVLTITYYLHQYIHRPRKEYPGLVTVKLSSPSLCIGKAELADDARAQIALSNGRLTKPELVGTEIPKPYTVRVFGSLPPQEFDARSIRRWQA